MYALKANFYPAPEPKAGYIGKADITVGNAIRLNNISVFENPDDGTLSIAFAKFGKDNERSYVIPSSKEAYAAMVGVINNAIASENHFGYSNGDLGVRLEVNGARVNEPYADGRFSVNVGDFCVLNGISTRVVEYSKDGKDGLAEDASFVAVDLPVLTDADGKTQMYTDKNGKEHANLQFEGLKNKYTNKEGKEVSVDYGVLMNNLIRKHRNELSNSLDATIGEANSKKSAPSREKEAPTQEQSR